jgi:deoxyribodipyrimidine photo-lyase
MSDARPTLFWFRRDLRLSDHPGLTAAAAAGGR